MTKQKNDRNRFFGQWKESTEFFVFRNGQRIIQRSSVMLLCPVWLRILRQGVVRERWKFGWSIWPTHIFTIRGHLKSVLGPRTPNNYRNRSTARILLRETSSFLNIKEKFLTIIARAGKTSWRRSLKFSVKLTK
jgi:hypothetical protein